LIIKVIFVTLILLATKYYIAEKNNLVGLNSNSGDGKTEESEFSG